MKALARKRRGRRRAKRVHHCSIVCLVPAHNEAAGIADALEGLRSQARPPDRIIVVADNCDDRTAELAAAVPGVEVIVTEGNRDKKAGALNQALDAVLPSLDDGDSVLVVDADSVLEHRFVEEAHRHVHRAEIGGVGGTFYGRPGGGFVGMLQRNEYARYARDVSRRNGRVLVLTGTAALFRAGVLREVVEARREGRLPGRPQVYDTHVLTEDSELTLAILHLGYRVVSPLGCRLTTEVMETWRDLYRQRLRWKRGAIENLTDYGWTNVTRAYWGRQLVSAVGVLVSAVYLTTLLYAALGSGRVIWHPLWVGVTALFAIERAVTVRVRGPVMMAVAATLVVEMCFDLFLQAVHARALVAAAVHTEKQW